MDKEERRKKKKAYTKAYSIKNRDKINKQRREYYKANPHKRSSRLEARNVDYRDKSNAKVYGLTLEEYRQMFIDCDNKCNICGKENGEKPNKLQVDHNHITGQVRGLLCRNCNTGIGYLKSDESIDIIKKAIEYLENNNG